jgi:hypothetical protein
MAFPHSTAELIGAFGDGGLKAMEKIIEELLASAKSAESQASAAAAER